MAEKPLRLCTPPPVGEFIREEIILAHGLTVTKAADVLGVTRPALSALLNGRASLSGEMALRLEKAFGFSMETLLRMQFNYDLAQTRRLADQIDVRPYVAALV